MTAIVVAAPPGSEGEAEDSLAAAAPGLRSDVVAGGATRAESVLAALAATETDLVLIHDAARPLVPSALFDAIAARLDRHPEADAVIAATALTDTVKRADRASVGGVPDEDAAVAETLRREYLWSAQTPQGFRLAALRRAQQSSEATGELSSATDEASLIEGAGGKVLLEPAPAHNLKVTTAEDLGVAASLLAALGRV